MARRFLSLIICLLSFVILCLGQVEKDTKIDWEILREAFKAYCELPSVENAEKVLVALPGEFDNRALDAAQWSLTVSYIWEGEPLRVLEELCRKGDKSALKIGFRTLLISDGAFTEDLMSVISESIRAKPRAFLEIAKDFLDNFPHKEDSLDGILLRDSDIGILDLDALRTEYQLRIESLSAINSLRLIEIRDACIRILKRFRDRFELSSAAR